MEGSGVDTGVGSGVGRTWGSPEGSAPGLVSGAASGVTIGSAVGTGDSSPVSGAGFSSAPPAPSCEAVFIWASPVSGSTAIV